MNLTHNTQRTSQCTNHYQPLQIKVNQLIPRQRYTITRPIGRAVNTRPHMDVNQLPTTERQTSFIVGYVFTGVFKHSLTRERVTVRLTIPIYLLFNWCF